MCKPQLPLRRSPVFICVRVSADRLVNSVCLLGDGSQGADLFLSLEAEAAQCLMSPPGRDRRRDREAVVGVVVVWVSGV